MQKGSMTDRCQAPADPVSYPPLEQLFTLFRGEITGSASSWSTYTGNYDCHFASNGVKMLIMYWQADSRQQQKGQEITVNPEQGHFDSIRRALNGEKGKHKNDSKKYEGRCSDVHS